MSLSRQPAGILIKSILPSTRVSLLTLNNSIALETLTACPGCMQNLKPVAIITASKFSHKIRVGLCTQCGYMGYMDRPSREWMINFYANEWDQSFKKTPEEMQKDIKMIQGGVKGSRHAAYALHEQLSVDKNRPVLDIGSGYGQVLKNFQNAGFKHVYGIENSAHRAKMVHDVFDITVVEGDFGNPTSEAKLKQYGPFGLAFTHHVLEHVYDPNEFVSSLSRLQSEGDHAIVALPDVAGEHINYVSLYLPHLHGFTKESLEALFNRHGYEMVIDASPNILNQIIAFKKTLNPQPRLIRKPDYEKTARARFAKGLGLDSYSEKGLHTLVWEQLITEHDTVNISKSGLPGFAFWCLWAMHHVIALCKSRILKRFSARYTMLVQPLFDQIPENSMFEIRYKDYPTLLIK